MKAVVYYKYGSPDVLELKEVEKPKPKDNEVLIKVHATTVTAGDWRMRKPDPFLARLMNGLFKPVRVKILGFELSGVIEATGSKVNTLKTGDKVFAFCGFKFGGYAEYRCLREDENIAIMPSNISFEEAASVPLGAMTALQFLKQAGISKGQKILIYGASGSVGTFAVQLASYFGAEVTAVCSGPNCEMVRSLGAKNVVDYQKEDFTRISDRFDIVFDAVGKASKSACRSLLTPSGKFMTVMSSPVKSKDDLIIVKSLIESGKLRTVIDRTYKLEEIRDAHRYVEQFHKKGNVVVKVS
jgi:NADPH:quinone reductase-like Zn-dependent oxidoreductase